MIDTKQLNNKNRMKVRKMHRKAIYFLFLASLFNQCHLSNRVLKAELAIQAIQNEMKAKK